MHYYQFQILFLSLCTFFFKSIQFKDIYCKNIFLFPNGIVFNSSFDSGHLYNVYQEKTSLFHLFLARDPLNDTITKLNMNWFYFSVTGVDPPTEIQFNIENMHYVEGHLKYGVSPVIYSSIEKKWQHISIESSPIILSQVSEETASMFFVYNFKSSSEVVYFAAAYPYSYSELQQKLKSLESGMSLKSSIYFLKETLIQSNERRDVDILWISSKKFMTDETVPFINGLFPKNSYTSGLKLFSWPKKYLFISARIHPGETPSSHILEGILDLLTDEADPYAKILRDSFVFGIIPMVNPDGVYHGHQRMDGDGINLNACYGIDSLEKTPSVYAIKNVIKTISKIQNVYAFIDLHAHQTFRGMFSYTDVKNGSLNEAVLLSMLLKLNENHYNFLRSGYSLVNTSHTASNSSIGGLSKVTNISKLYTIETNYWSDDFFDKNLSYLIRFNDTTTKIIDVSYFYTVSDFKNYGFNILKSILQDINAEPQSTINLGIRSELLNILQEFNQNYFNGSNHTAVKIELNQKLNIIKTSLEENENSDRLALLLKQNKKTSKK